MKYKNTDSSHNFNNADRNRRERGSASVIVLLILVLVSAFVILAMSRTVNETMIMNNDQSSTRAFYAAEASLETMTRNFNKIFDSKFEPTPQDVDRVEDNNHKPRGFDDFTFIQDVTAPAANSSQVSVLTGGPFEGMTALRDTWNLNATATFQNGAQVQLSRDFINNRIPIFQFAAFYDDDFECHPGPYFKINGRVHTNGNLYIEGGNGGSYYNGRVTASGEVVSGVARNGWGVFINNPGWVNGQVFITNGAGGQSRLYGNDTSAGPGGSVLNGPDLTATDPDVADGTRNPQWSQCAVVPKIPCKPDNDVFNGNLQAHVKTLKLPLKKNSNSDNVELIKRGLPTDTTVLAASRYANKPGIRVSVSDAQIQLPGGTGGVRLDGKGDGTSAPGVSSGSRATAGDNTRGYEPKPMGGYQASRLNGNRFYTGISYDASNPTSTLTANRQTWIKVERVNVDPISSAITATDITEDFLSMGVTEAAPCSSSTAVKAGGSYCSNNTDARSVIKLQRYTIPGATISGIYNSTLGYQFFPYHAYVPGDNINIVTTNPATASTALLANERTTASQNNFLPITFGGASAGVKIVPFPIEMFDTREGLYSEDVDTNAVYGGKVTTMGVMSMVDIDVANFRTFIRGTYDGQFTSGLRSTDIQKDNKGWIIYVSDRRGDKDNDGEFDMENIYVDQNDPNGNNNGNKFPQFGENASGNKDAVQTNPLLKNLIETDYEWEGSRYKEGADYLGKTWTLGSDPVNVVNPTTNQYQATVPTDIAAVFDHKYYRRGVRLINAQLLPSVSVGGVETGGFTLATENGAYILGNINTSGTGGSHVGTVASFGGENYPSSVAADAATLLSRDWKDGNSFNAPFTGNGNVKRASETSYRTALLIGDTIGSLWINRDMTYNDYSQGSAHYRLNGALHEGIVRTLENWQGIWMNYCGSYINLYNSRNNTGSWKLGGPQHVFSPQEQNRTFDSVFLNPQTIPPGTPFFQYVQVTAFRRNNE